MWKTLFLCTVYFTSVFSTVVWSNNDYAHSTERQGPSSYHSLPKGLQSLDYKYFSKYFQKQIFFQCNTSSFECSYFIILVSSYPLTFQDKNYPNKSLHTKRMGLRYQLGPPNSVKLKGSLSETRPWINYDPQRVVWRVKIHIGERK